MKKKLFFSVACLFISVCSFGQDVNAAGLQGDVIQKGDTAQVTTINDIIKMQQEVTSMNFRDSHYRKVWGRKSYLNVAYNNTTLTPDGVVETGVAYNEGNAPEYKSNWGLSLQVGRNYALHKRPIANILQFNFDYTFIDLNVNHFKAENDGKDLYDSRAILPGTTDMFYTPWNLEKYDINYGMAVGPSVTVAPFTHTNYAGLHHLKFNVYFHIGYQAALLYMKKDMDEKQQILIMRGFLVFFLILSVVLALNPPTFIAQLMGISWGALAGAFLAPFLYGLYWKGVTKAAVWASFASGILITVLNLFPATKFIESPINAGAIAMVAGLVVVPVVSLLTPKMDQKEVDKVFDCYNQKHMVEQKYALSGEEN